MATSLANLVIAEHQRYEEEREDRRSETASMASYDDSTTEKESDANSEEVPSNDDEWDFNETDTESTDSYRGSRASDIDIEVPPLYFAYADWLEDDSVHENDTLDEDEDAYPINPFVVGDKDSFDWALLDMTDRSDDEEDTDPAPFSPIEFLEGLQCQVWSAYRLHCLGPKRSLQTHSIAWPEAVVPVLKAMDEGCMEDVQVEWNSLVQSLFGSSTAFETLVQNMHTTFAKIFEHTPTLRSLFGVDASRLFAIDHIRSQQGTVDTTLCPRAFENLTREVLRDSLPRTQTMDIEPEALEALQVAAEHTLATQFMDAGLLAILSKNTCVTPVQLQGAKWLRNGHPF